MSDSLAGEDSAPQDRDEPIVLQSSPGTDPPAHVVLYQPEIPQNTGNIGRTCVATGAALWIVQPAAFRLDDRAVRRAGLDYWQHLRIECADHWEDLQQRLPETPRRRYWYFSRFAKKSIWSVEFQQGDVLVFGRETSGLPPSIHEQAGDRLLRLPTTEQVRSLNLSNTVAVAVYELIRQTTNCRR